MSGDAQRARVLSSPTSPATSPPSNAQSFSSMSAPLKPSPDADLPLSIDPALSLELRIRWLEVLLLGARQDSAEGQRAAASVKAKQVSQTLVRGTEELQNKINEIADSNDGLRKFMDRYDRHADLLTPAFALSEISSPPNNSSLSPEELDALLVEMEPDVKSADRDLREIDILEKRGVLGAGKLGEHKDLIPQLEALRKAHEEDLERAGDLERRIASALRRYATRVDALSELFVEWNDVLSSAEDKVSRLEKEKAEKIRMGLESNPF